jgi:hypothetical protein
MQRYITSNHRCDETIIIKTIIINYILEQRHKISYHETASATTALLHPETFAANLRLLSTYCQVISSTPALALTETGVAQRCSTAF